ncbi:MULTISPECIES: hypothetical protein [Enterobacter cloacae complex]|uniref:Uncharacterized protein n=1 Tax=Enterobacter cloacae TaxID=550 RepID=A0A7H8UAQ5_ENTCL|nr:MULTISPECIES: hypothetical protein [Enterobacter cloacae complex]MDE4080979.1 hypothetical protein [Enterobacter pasteurii]QKZ96990.1 hypothetical protein HWQ14_04450 [Enterobacter cloacae]
MTHHENFFCQHLSFEIVVTLITGTKGALPVENPYAFLFRLRIRPFSSFYCKSAWFINPLFFRLKVD